MATEPIGTVLTVEDEPEIRKLTAMYAESLGFAVLEAEDGQAAIDLLATARPDIIVSDMKMPRKDGMTLLKELREQGNQTPFLFLSAFTTKEYTVRALSLGAFDYLEKPFLPNEFKALLSEMLRVSKARKAALQTAGLATIDSEHSVSPEAEILKMSSLSKSEGIVKSTEFPVHIDRKARLLQMFIIEVQSQLQHGLKALTDLKHADSPGWQLGYLFRLMYSIRSTAASLNLNEIRDLTHVMEQTYVLLRVRTSYLNKMTLATLQVAHDVLRRHIDCLATDKSGPAAEDILLKEETEHVMQDLRVIITSK